MSASALGLVVASVALRTPIGPPARVAPAAEPQASPAAALTVLLDGDPGGVVAFGELHERRGGPSGRSALGIFTEEMLPVLAPMSSHLVIETWLARGDCGEPEAKVTEEVERTTERPAATESEIVRLIRRAKEAGVTPHILEVGCQEYTALLGDGGKVDYDRLLTATTGHLERAIRRALAAPRRPGRPLVLVYGGALHNDLHPGPGTERYTFGPAVHALVRGAYREIDVYPPRLVEAMSTVRAEPWYRVWQRERRRRGAGRQGGAAELVFRRSARSAVILFRQGR